MKKSFYALLALAGLATNPALAQDAESLFQNKACAACHATDVQLVGPAFTDVAKEYSDQDDAVGILVDSIMNGSTGKWGQLPMPPNNVTEEEATALAEWVLEQG
ncbi:c-type cytochrome [Litchfieldella xinjiangensis]|uniref:c-type cytochrome n=1 Tax=Litchfieldella xinjiangensis TaxID=1166948 RepID=UPI0005B90D27|nr:c-type cytochrome [Halomonas xinjiangensis]